MNLKPKSKEEMLKDLNHLRKELGLTKTDGSMKITREIIKKKGSFLYNLEKQQHHLERDLFLKKD